MKLGKKIKELRLHLGMAQYQLAQAASLTQSYLCKIEVGQNVPNAKRVIDISRALGANEDELIALGVEDYQEQAKIAYLRDQAK